MKIKRDFIKNIVAFAGVTIFLLLLVGIAEYLGVPI